MLGGGVASAEILRSVSAALEQAADRAEHGERGATQLPNGTTVINGRTFVTVNGKPVDPQELAQIYGSLPGVIGAAMRHLGPATFPIPDVAPAAGALPATTNSGATVTDLGATSAASPVPTTPMQPPAPTTPTGIEPTPAITDLAAAGIPGATVPAAAPSPATSTTDADLPARVTINGFQDTGVDIGGNRLYTFDLTVAVAGRQPYPLKHAAVVPRAQVARLTNGASFPAQVDPTIPGNVTVHWDR
jgi:hypothetical protein